MLLGKKFGKLGEIMEVKFIVKLIDGRWYLDDLGFLVR